MGSSELARQGNWRRVKKHRTYTYEEAARALDLHKNTIRTWVRSEGLEALTDRRPHLILGVSLIAFLKRRRERNRTRLRIDEMFCFRCKVPRIPDGNLADCEVNERSSANLSGICPACSTMMFKRVSLKAIGILQSRLDVMIKQAPSTLRKENEPC